MIQYHKVSDLEVAISLGILIPKDAPNRSRHRFWVDDRRLDAFKSTRGDALYLHWVVRAPEDKAAKGGVRECAHPELDGFHHGVIYLNPDGTYSGRADWYYRRVYNDGSVSHHAIYTGSEFKMCKATEEGR